MANRTDLTLRNLTHQRNQLRIVVQRLKRIEKKLKLKSSRQYRNRI